MDACSKPQQITEQCKASVQYVQDAEDCESTYSYIGMQVCVLPAEQGDTTSRVRLTVDFS